MDKLGDMLNQPVALAAGHLAAGMLETAQKACDRLTDEKDSEALHHFRVSVRKLRTYLQAYRDHLDKTAFKKAGRVLRELMKATNRDRDDQVHVRWLRHHVARRRVSQLERSGIRLALDELEARRATMMDDMPRVQEQFGKVARKMQRRLQRKPGPLKLDDRRMAVNFAAALDELVGARTDELRRRLANLHQGDDLNLAHQVRLASKRLRYLLEPVREDFHDARPIVRRLKALQDVLGTMNDLQVLSQRVDASMSQLALDYSSSLGAAARSKGNLSGLRRDLPTLRACHALAAVLRRIHIEQTGLLKRCRREWDEERASRFFATVDRLRLKITDRDRNAPPPPTPPTDVETHESISAEDAGVQP
jgi:CHAD domain-containing protein